MAPILTAFSRWVRRSLVRLSSTFPNGSVPPAPNLPIAPGQGLKWGEAV
jgi:hypothetical protein